jgi:hypothetical protein
MGALFYLVQPILLIPGPRFTMILYSFPTSMSTFKHIAEFRDDVVQLTELRPTGGGLWVITETWGLPTSHPSLWEWMVEDMGFSPFGVARALGLPVVLEDYWA